MADSKASPLNRDQAVSTSHEGSTKAASNRMTSEQFAAEVRQTDRLLAFFIVLLAFVLASFPIVDSRYWLSLRTGQLISAGEFDFQSDPFSYATGGQTWIHPGWLSDYLFFRVHEGTGPAALVLMRGLFCALFAVAMLRWLPVRGSHFWPLVAILLSVMTLAPRLWIRPELFSLLGTFLTLYLLTRPAEPQSKSLLAPLLRWTAGRWYLFLPLLFAAWANLDEWFVLGPALALLWWLGSIVEPALRGSHRSPTLTSREQKALLASALIGIAACAANPYHLRVFGIPGELHSDALSFLNEKFAARRMSISPFHPDLFGQTRLLIQPLGLTACEWAYYFLAGLSFVSFLLAGNFRNGPRLISWLGFFLLGAWQTRNAGFFAMVAGPITVLNLVDWLNSLTAETKVTRASVAGAMFVRLGFLLFLFITLPLAMLEYRDVRPGELLGDARLGLVNPRGQVGWSAFPDPSMAALAEWRHPPTFPADAGEVFYMNFGEPAGYEAWFNPGSKVFIDFRFRLHGATVAEYFDAYEALRDSELPPSPLAPPEVQRRYLASAEPRRQRWEAVFRKYGISHIVVNNRIEVRVNPNDPSGGQIQVPRHELLLSLRDERNEPLFIPLSYIDDYHFVLAWRGSPQLSKLQSAQLEPTALAFRRNLPPPPVSIPATVPSVSPLGLFLEGAPMRYTPRLGGALWWLQNFQVGLNQRREAARQSPIHLFTHYSLTLAAWPATFTIPMLAPPHLFALDGTDPSRLYLSLRDARFALQDLAGRSDLDSRFFQAQAWETVAQAYEALFDEERTFSRGMPILQREFQSLAARRQAVARFPDKPEYHQVLGVRFLTRRNPAGISEPILDEGFFHLQMALELYKLQGMIGPRPATPQEIEIEFKRLVNRSLGLKLEEVEKELRNRQAAFNQRAPKGGDGPAAAVAVRRAEEAIRLGLWAQADLELRDAFVTTDPTLQRRLLTRSIEIHYTLGHLPQLIEKLRSPVAAQALGTNLYHQFAASAHAAAGDFSAAIGHRQALISMLEEDAARTLAYGAQFQTLGAMVEPTGSWEMGLRQTLGENLSLGQQIAEQYLLAGLLQIELGQPAAALPLLRRAALEIDPSAPASRVASRYYFLIAERFVSSEPRRDSSP